MKAHFWGRLLPSSGSDCAATAGAWVWSLVREVPYSVQRRQEVKQNTHTALRAGDPVLTEDQRLNQKMKETSAPVFTPWFQGNACQAVSNLQETHVFGS